MTKLLYKFAYNACIQPTAQGSWVKGWSPYALRQKLWIPFFFKLLHIDLPDNFLVLYNSTRFAFRYIIQKVAFNFEHLPYKEIMWYIMELNSQKNIWTQRFHGVVGYHTCLTHRRAPDRARLESVNHPTAVIYAFCFCQKLGITWSMVVALCYFLAFFSLCLLFDIKIFLCFSYNTGNRYIIQRIT